jgi:hypothetical protein
MSDYHRAIAVLEDLASSPTFRPVAAGKAEDACRAMLVRLRQGDERAELLDAVEVIDRVAGRVDLTDAARIERRLNAARERIAVRAGLRRRGGA